MTSWRCTASSSATGSSSGRRATCRPARAVISSTPAGRRRLGSVGLPLPGYEVRILDEMDQEVPLGERGEICCRAPGVMLGYWDAPETTADTLRGGWLHTGDIGYLDEDGYLWVVDRKKDLIIRGGFNVFPRDVEETLVAHPAVGKVDRKALRQRL